MGGVVFIVAFRLSSALRSTAADRREVRRSWSVRSFGDTIGLLVISTETDRCFNFFKVEQDRPTASAEARDPSATMPCMHGRWRHSQLRCEFAGGEILAHSVVPFRGLNLMSPERYGMWRCGFVCIEVWKGVDSTNSITAAGLPGKAYRPLPITILVSKPS